jgi:hypothetical protein
MLTHQKDYEVASLVLSRSSNDRDKLVVNVGGNEGEQLEQAIKMIQAEFAVRETQAKEYVDFLNTLESEKRLNDYHVNKKWEQYLQSKIK